MQLIKLIKAVIHVYNEKNELKYSFWDCGDYTDEQFVEKRNNEWCAKKNEEAGYKKYTYEIVNLYGEVRKW